MEKERKKLAPARGDHIFVRRSIHYSHHGIYINDDKVIHYQTPMETGHPGPSACRVLEGPISTFLGQNQDWCLFRYGIEEKHAKLYPKGTYTSKPCDEPDIVIQRAKEAIKDGFSHYNIVGNNCEDFATYCKTGKRSMESAQFSAALECVAAARRAVDQGYRSPLVYAGCVLGLLTARDFKHPPVNRIPPAQAVAEEQSCAGQSSCVEGSSKGEKRYGNDNCETNAESDQTRTPDSIAARTTTSSGDATEDHAQPTDSEMSSCPKPKQTGTDQNYNDNNSRKSVSFDIENNSGLHCVDRKPKNDVSRNTRKD